jgi:hypothetical protein
MSALASRLPDAAWFHRHRAKFAGFASGVALQLVLAGMVSAMSGGGFSDRPLIEPSPYVLY